jgi:phospholipase C
LTNGAFWATAVLLLLTVGFANPALLPPASVPAQSTTEIFPTGGSGLPGHLPNDHIQHVVEIMLENHDYDSYFGTYCLVLGPYCSMTGNGIPANTCVPYYPSYPQDGCVVPFNLTPAQFTIPDMEHDWITGPIAYNEGAMNGFYQAEGTTNTFGHYNQSTIPIYWDMAEEYATSDNFWGGNLSYSLPNHWQLVSATTPEFAYDHYLGNAGVQSEYLSEANNTSSVEDLLDRANVSWRYYDNSLMSYGSAIDGVIWGGAYDYWNPMAAQAESYTSPYLSHFVPRSAFIGDVDNGTLPNVSYLIPDFDYSDHPGWNNSYGETWIAELVNAVEASKYWNSTVIFVTWDDYGGWYDHVPPPTVLGHGLSFRAPLLVISPYAKENFIGHSMGDFWSLLHFVEWQFGLGCLRPQDCLAPLPLQFFNFNQPPRAPILFQTSWTTARYPMALQQAGAINMDCAPCLDTSWNAWGDSNITPANSPNINFS